MSMLLVRFLSQNKPEDVEALQALFFAAPRYSQIVFGKAVEGNEAMEAFTSLPPGKTLGDKLVLGFYKGEELVGCADVIRGYPSPEIAFIGLLLFSEKNQNRGLGVIALQHIEELARDWSCSAIRLAVIATNTHALSFWMREGFTEIFRKVVPDTTGEAIVMQRPISFQLEAGRRR
jgi:diamine N-acetyltransferase